MINVARITTSIANKLSRSTYILILLGAVFAQPLFTSPCYAKVKADEKIKIAVFDSPASHEHSKNVLGLFKKELKSCTRCKFILMPIYNGQGDLDLNKFQAGLKAVDSSFALVHLSWNMPEEDRFADIHKEFKRIAKLNIPLIAAAGEPLHANEMALPVEQTVMGHEDKVILVGELDKKGKLPIRAYYGPSILVALSAPKDLPGSSFSSVLVSVEIIKRIEQGIKKDWHETFLQTKHKSFKAWPALEDYFK